MVFHRIVVERRDYVIGFGAPERIDKNVKSEMERVRMSTDYPIMVITFR